MEDVILVNGEEYTKKAQNVEGMKYVIIRTRSAGVFAGYLRSRDGKEGIIINSRRIWKWVGAATLSQLSQNGTTEPDNCMFPCVVPETLLTEIVEMIPCSEKARLSILGVKVWEK